MPLNFSPKARASSVFSCSINRRWIASASRAQYGRSTRYNTKTDCAGDFDIITAAWPASLTPGNELRGYWGSRAAEEPGSPNRIGIKNAAVDAMIDQIVFAKNRADLEAATRALDRILLWNHYVVPQWYYN